MMWEPQVNEVENDPKLGIINYSRGKFREVGFTIQFIYKAGVEFIKLLEMSPLSQAHASLDWPIFRF